MSVVLDEAVVHATQLQMQWIALWRLCAQRRVRVERQQTLLKRTGDGARYYISNSQKDRFRAVAQLLLENRKLVEHSMQVRFLYTFIFFKENFFILHVF